ncbi:MAG: NADH-quinone oxidoreductase subunit C [Armatimonadetes bacterium]|nr:NADH-quinone oxidoreductase subunit C [Armatimonadota bacterium]
MNEEALVEQIRSGFASDAEVRRARRIWVTVPAGEIAAFCEFAKGIGFDHLSAVSVTDFVDDGQFELTHTLWSYEHKVLLVVKSRIDRSDPVVDSVSHVWPGAGVHEREMHEMFGVVFEGNPDLSELFLEDWEGPPPFRKDFDTRQYVRDNYLDENNERERSYWGDTDA